MTQKLWQKSGTKTLPEVTAFMTSPNLEADQKLLPFDIQASKAHAKMLGKIGLLSAGDVRKLTGGLDEILALHKKGQFKLEQKNEDVHTAIESYLSEHHGDVGKRIHLGRSRNDQILVAMRLMMLAELESSAKIILTLAEKLLGFAMRYEFVPMPGFTHMQHAMPSSVGQWAGAFVDSLIFDAELILSVRELINQNPLGSAAGFGTAVPLDREMTAKELGFDQVQINPIFCQQSRAKFETLVLHALSQSMMTLGKTANDMVIFTCQEFSFFHVDSAMTTGSSIMPQKQNLDVCEVVRANVAIVMSLEQQVKQVGLNIISGYNKDLKITKKAVLDGFDLAQASAKIMTLLFDYVVPNEARLLETLQDAEIYSADMANELAMNGMAFRDAYREVGERLKTLKPQDPVKNIKAKKHLGATGNLGLKVYQSRIKNLAKKIG